MNIGILNGVGSGLLWNINQQEFIGIYMVKKEEEWNDLFSKRQLHLLSIGMVDKFCNSIYMGSIVKEKTDDGDTFYYAVGWDSVMQRIGLFYDDFYPIQGLGTPITEDEMDIYEYKTNEIQKMEVVGHVLEDTSWLNPLGYNFTLVKEKIEIGQEINMEILRRKGIIEGTLSAIDKDEYGMILNIFPSLEGIQTQSFILVSYEDFHQNMMEIAHQHGKQEHFWIHYIGYFTILSQPLVDVKNDCITFSKEHYEAVMIALLSRKFNEYRRNELAKISNKLDEYLIKKELTISKFIH